jgi:hypothetical protein
VSSYSYLIVPTTTAKPFSADKGTTLSKYILYMVCAGQQKAAQLGYSPLPGNLVQAAFNVVLKIPGHVNPPPLNQCDNPNLNGQIGNDKPPPPLSDKQGAAPPPSSGGGPITGGAGGTVTGGAGGTVTGNSSTTGGATGATGAKARRLRRLALGNTNNAPLGDTLTASSGPVTPPTQRDPLPLLLYIIAAVAALVAIFGPPTVSSYVKRNNAPGSDTG